MHSPIREILDEEETGTDVWRQFEYVYDFPATDDTIRFELGIMRPGTLWIDDVRIEEVE